MVFLIPVVVIGMGLLVSGCSDSSESSEPEPSEDSPPAGEEESESSATSTASGDSESEAASRSAETEPAVRVAPSDMRGELEDWCNDQAVADYVAEYDRLSSGALRRSSDALLAVLQGRDLIRF